MLNQYDISVRFQHEKQTKFKAWNAW